MPEANASSDASTLSGGSGSPDVLVGQRVTTVTFTPCEASALAIPVALFAIGSGAKNAVK